MDPRIRWTVKGGTDEGVVVADGSGGPEGRQEESLFLEEPGTSWGCDPHEPVGVFARPGPGSATTSDLRKTGRGWVLRQGFRSSDEG